MSPSNQLIIGFIKFFFFSVLSFFLIPGITYVFVEYAKPQIDGHYSKVIELRVNGQTGLTREQRQDLLTLVRALPPSAACASEAPEIQSYRAAVCPFMGEAWQFHMAETLSWWTLIGGVGVFALIFVLGAQAFVNRAALYYSFLAGWRILIAVSVLEVLVQGVLAVWLSYWVTGFFFHFYVVKIILFVALLALMGAGYAVWWMFKKPTPGNGVEGEPLLESAEPALWTRVRALAKRLDTAPPGHIVAGIDCNFFVTQMPLTVNGHELRGRTLFVSLPLLRQFSETEADAVLAHELAHFRGGDARSGALLGPKLNQFDLYRSVMAHRGIFIAAFILQLYRLIFELALKRDGRKREFIADRMAASIVSAQALINALIKLSAYAGYRGQIERSLYQSQARHQEALSIADRVAAGLQTYASSAQFIDQMRTSHTPHPFDSHPRLTDRMKNVGLTVEEHDFAAIVTALPGRTWADDISGADAIEKQLWSKYEESFASQHEMSLAFRYLPANAEEEAVVLRLFPNARFALAKDKFIAVTYAGITVPPSSPKSPPQFISWDDVKEMTMRDKRLFSPHKLLITHPRGSGLRRSSTNVPLHGIGKQLAPMKLALARCWQRHQIMRQVLGEKAAAPSLEVPSA